MSVLKLPVASLRRLLVRRAASMAENLAVLYTLTEDPRYAHKAGVLLDRMADLYPEFTYRPGRPSSTAMTGTMAT